MRQFVEGFCFFGVLVAASSVESIAKDEATQFRFPVSRKAKIR